MFTIELNEQIGAHLRNLIHKRFASERQFCKAYAYLEKRGHEVNDDEIRKVQNRFSQILNGKKAIQTYDLPIITELLDVSCEEILSAGKLFVPVSSRVTNYSVAFSKDPSVWQAYINRKDKLILNYDEYGKSVLDYAFEFKNYGFLKYLTDQGYIVFHYPEDDGYSFRFGADTTIKRRDITQTDPLEADLKYSDNLRMNLLALAIENEDVGVLDLFRARETPMLHWAAVYSQEPPEPERYDCSDMVGCIASASDKVLDYFSTKYAIKAKQATMPSCFLYQHLGAVIEAMLKNRDPRVKKVIDQAIAHNQTVYSKIKGIYSDAINNIATQSRCSKSNAREMVFVFSRFYKSCDVVRFGCWGTEKTLVANIIRVDIDTAAPNLIDDLKKLNNSYDSVRTFVEKEVQ